MLINTRDFGEIEVADEDLYTFPLGLFAFEDLRTFALISPLGEDVYPKWLQSAEDVVPCFIVFDPNAVSADYKVTLDTKQERLLRLSSNEYTGLLVIATVPSDFTKTTVNMKAPIVVNYKDRLAAQIILPTDEAFKHPLYNLSEAGEK